MEKMMMAVILFYQNIQTSFPSAVFSWSRRTSGKVIISDLDLSLISWKLEPVIAIEGVRALTRGKPWLLINLDDVVRAEGFLSRSQSASYFVDRAPLSFKPNDCRKGPEIWKLSYADNPYRSKSRFEMLRDTESFGTSKKDNCLYQMCNHLLIYRLGLAPADKNQALFWSLSLKQRFFLQSVFCISAPIWGSQCHKFWHQNGRFAPQFVFFKQYAWGA